MYCGRIATIMVKNKRDLKFSPHKTRSARRPSTSGKMVGNEKTSCANVKVVVRVRPPNQKELASNSRIVINVADQNTIIFDPKQNDEPFYYHGVAQRGRDLLKKANKNIQFTFDRVFGFDSDNNEVFTDSTKDLIITLMDGYNCSVFVYGATGAGKTHTMLGHNGNPGITMLTMKELFQHIHNLKNERDFELGITYLEVYNETVKDLLNPGGPLHLREDGKYGVCVPGIDLKRISNPEELFALLEKGNANRTQHPTDANAESSRSHAVFQVYVNMLNRKTGQRRIAKLSMIDLAGSERGAATGCKGIRFTEGANINKSLLALGNCINSLADGRSHIPYRDSKLTRLLKDSLGGNCQTVMIANISPSSLNYEDTYNTLKYATRAKKIKSSMIKNEVTCNLTIPEYKKLVEELNREMDILRAKLKSAESTPRSETDSVASSTEVAVVCACGEEKKQDIEPTNEPAVSKEITNYEDWRLEFKELLQERLTVFKQIKRLKNSEAILSRRIKFKELSDNICNDLCVDDEQLEVGRNRINNTIGMYRRQWQSIISQLDELKKRNCDIENKIKKFIDQNNISVDDKDLLINKIEINAIQYELQTEFTSKVIDLDQSEIDQANKLIHRISDMLNTYHQLLRGHGYVTENMADTYRSVVRMAQGVRSVTFQENDIECDGKSQDSGIGLSSNIISIKTSPPKLNGTFTHSSKLTSPEKRSSVKRKLYSLTDEDNAKQEPNLNETITIPSTIKAETLNSTFCLHEKEPIAKKKSVLSDRSNMVCAENLLPKVHKSSITTKKSTLQSERNFKINNKFYTSTITKTQRFPIRKNDSNKEAVSNRASRLRGTAISRINNNTTPNRFKY